MNSMRVLSDLFQGIFLLWVSSCLISSVAAVSANESDWLALLDFKNRITRDPSRILSSWNDSLHFCNWFGVSCSPSNGRVTILNLESRSLVGTLPPSIGNLTYLRGINLQNNSFHGELPQEMGSLRLLQHINFTGNSFEGNIPTNLTHCTELTVLEMGLNDLSGEIPDQLSTLSKLVILSFGRNNLAGGIPPWIGNFSYLYGLVLALNNFQGIIPNELGKLSRLGMFQVYGNSLSGTIPPAIYNISSLYYFSVTENQLHGQLPPDVGLTLPNLQVFAGGVNNFTGPIPVSMSNASGLVVFDFAQNGFTGTIPTILGRLQSLVRLNFDQNDLGTAKTGDLSFISSLANCTILQVLGLAQNRFGGELPSYIANLSSQLQILTLGSNLIQGSIPIGIENLVNLNLLGLEGNHLSGNVPDAIGRLQNLEGVHLNLNSFSGPIPSSIGNLTILSRLFMEENRFEGRIPQSLGNCENLQNLNLSSNNLTGTIPKEVIGISSLSVALVMSNNFLTGSVPLEVGTLDNLVKLDLSENKLSGEIPSTIGGCIRLERLLLQGNEFEGTIPESVQNLRGLGEIDLSSNNLSGNIPQFFSQLSSLQLLNLSYNDFEGEVPTDGIFANASAVSVAGNEQLCGGIPELGLPPCSRRTRRNGLSHKVAIIIAAIAVSTVIAISSAVTIYCMLRNPRRKQSTELRNPRRRQSTEPPADEWEGGMSYSEILIATEGFAAENLIGSGSFGSVYRGVLPGDGRVVAIKVLNLQRQGASRSFADERNALRSIRHRNLLKIINVCSTADHQGNEFKCLVFQFLPNGSLDQWLHPRNDELYETRRLSLTNRLDIAIDIANALEYLHQHCDYPIVHCDLKPSNVLLDEDLTAHVGDFGLARFLIESSLAFSSDQTLSGGLKGSIGYIPPEYGQGGCVSTLGDIYSYGILLLEIFTGKRPTDDMFKDDTGIHKFVSMAFPQHVMDIIDTSMLVEEENEVCNENYEVMEERAIIRADNYDRREPSSRKEIQECLESVIKIGLLCSARSPAMRMDIHFVVNKLNDIRDSYFRSKNRFRSFRRMLR